MIIDKSKIALRKKFILGVLVEKWRELCDKCFCPRDFPFAEKWFYPSEVDWLLREYCSKNKLNIQKRF